VEILTVKADSVPATPQTLVLAVANRIRKLHAITWYYVCSSNVNNRVITVTYNTPLGAAPAAYATLERVYKPGSLTIPELEDGMVYIDKDRAVITLQGVMTEENNSTNKAPMPYVAHEDDTMTVVFAATNIHSSDRDAIYALVETWLVM
jgi:hypothetical protein